MRGGVVLGSPLPSETIRNLPDCRPEGVFGRAAREVRGGVVLDNTLPSVTMKNLPGQEVVR